MSSPDASSAFVERLGSALTSAGLARMPSRLFAAVLVDEDGRMTAAELAETLGVSPASISGAVRYLDGVGMVRRERERGTRRDVFVVDDVAWHEMLLHSGQIYAPLITALDRGLAELPADHPAVHRIRLSREFMSFITEEMASMGDRWTARVRELGLDQP